MSTANERRATAYHEAGHAVAAYRMNLLTETTTIRPDRDRGVMGFSRSEDACYGDESADDVVVVLYAGLAAERLVNPDAMPEHGAWQDYEDAARIHGEDTPPQHLVDRAAEMVEKDRAAIEAVADALLEFETLPGEESDVIVGCVDEGLDWRTELLAYRARFARCSASRDNSDSY